MSTFVCKTILGLIGCTLHFIVHIIQTLIIKKYIPAFITSIIGIPVGIFIIDKSIKILNYSFYAILTYIIIGIIYRCFVSHDISVHRV